MKKVIHRMSGAASIASALCVLAQICPASDLYVDQSNPACPGTGTAADPFCNIQDAVAASTHGDVIHVAPGTYTENVIVNGRDISIISTAGRLATTIDAGGTGSAIRFQDGAGTSPVIQGFKLCNGSGTEQRGGGVHIDSSSPTLIDCSITNNHTVGRGGGVYARNLSEPTFEGCLFTLNSTAIDGGAIFQETGSLTLTSCDLYFNHARDNGGGLYTRNDVQLELVGCALSWNSTLDQDGAGMYLNGTSLVATKTEFFKNFSGRDGSGMAIQNGSVTQFNECKIKGNRSVRDGGGILIGSAEFTSERTHLIENSCGRNGAGIAATNNAAIDIYQGFFRRNHSKGLYGGAIYMDSVDDLVIDTCKFLSNMARVDGGGIYAVNSSNSTFVRCGFVKNLARNGRGGAFNLNSSSPTLDYCTFTLNGAEYESSAIYGRNLSMPTIKNSIMWGDIGAEIILVIGNKAPGTGSNTTSVTYTDIEGGWPGANNIDVDPRFVDAQNGDIHLRAISPVRGLSEDGLDLGAYQYGS